MFKSLPGRFILLAGVMLAGATAGAPGGAQVGGKSTTNLAPGAPGRDAQWASAGKTAVGTSQSLGSKVWFTLREGVMTEVYYPTVDVANTRALEFIIVSGSGQKRIELESDDTTHRVEILDPRALSFRQVNTAKSGAYVITKTYTTDPQRHTVLIDVRFEARARGGGPYALYVYYDPALNNSGMHDSAWTERDALLASDADKASALVSSTPFDELTNGYFETSDGLTELRREGRIASSYRRAANGNVVQVARVRADAPLTLALGFGREADEALRNARDSLAEGFARVRTRYEAGWHVYVATLRRVGEKYQRQFDMAAMVLKAHEDKTYRGAMIASLSVPWGGGANANEPNVGGYHLVWARDLYQVATAFAAVGDKAAADRALHYLFTVQQKPDGSFPQNSWLDGRPFWGSLQLDEVAYPLILAYQLGRTDNETWTKHVKRAADYIVRFGPSTPQERWEEEAGYSPSTIAAEIAGLVCAAEIARRNGDEASAGIYLAAADDWTRNVERWTATSTGPHADGTYYLRVTENDNPNDGAPLEINNGGGSFDERAIVDAGFLELVRLGVKSPHDPLIAKSLAVVDRLIRVETPHGSAWYRYNHDGYGEKMDGARWDGSGTGRLWVLLTGERGEYELARGEKEAARHRLDAMLGFANEGLMIPEQVWDRETRARPDLPFGEGTGSATPLAWSMAGFIRLAASLEEGRNIALPEVVAARYVKGPAPAHALTDYEAPAEEALQRMETGSSFKIRGRLQPLSRAYAMIGGETREIRVDAGGSYEFEVPVGRGDMFVLLGTRAPDGATAFHRALVRGLTPEEKRVADGTAQSPELVERLKRTTRGPIIEGGKATFVFRGAARRVEVVGDFTNWRPRSLVMRRLPGTDISYYSRAFARDARVEYKFIADGEWMLDPLNPDHVNNGVGGFNSFLTMPDYRASAEAEDAAGPARGTLLEAIEVPSRLLGGSRRVQVYLPRAYDASPAERYPVLYLQDGSDYITRGRAVQVADNLVARKKIAPFIIVFIDPTDRMKEYWANDLFADFLATELVPFVDGRFRTRRAREARALLGASLGGVISVWTALRHPEIFARVGGQSSAFQIDNERVVRALEQLERAKMRPLRFYLDVGRLEPLLEINRRVRVMLAARGYAVTYREAEAGHNYTTWRDLLADAYLGLWRD